MTAADAAARAAIAIAGGLSLDALIGDPVSAWHPVRLLGRLAARAESAARALFRAPPPISPTASRPGARPMPDSPPYARPATGIPPDAPTGEPYAPDADAARAALVAGAPAPATSAPTSAIPGPSAARQRLAGAAAWVAVAGAASAAAWGLCAAARALHPILGAAADVLVAWASIAPADLAAHASRVRRALERDAADAAVGAEPSGSRAGAASANSATGAGISEPVRGRAAVAMLVGRDVSALDEAGVARACVESVAESSVDGAASPLFWAALLGPWAAFAYRAVNTMDSMFGHKDDRYLHFGLVPARADDVANWLPARISSILACAAAPLVGGDAPAAFGSFRRWRLAHESPNAGHPESAYAGALGLRLGGPSRYAEGVIDKPWINPAGGEARPADIARATKLMYLQTVLSAASFLALRAAVARIAG